MKDFDACPQCSVDLRGARAALPEGTSFTFCPSCQFPLVVVANKYRLEKVIGEGGAGTVYLAHHVRLTRDTERVVKILKPELFKFEGMEERFEREVQITSSISLRNNHIVRIYDDFGQIPKVGFFYVMEYLEGSPLDALLEDPRNPPPRDMALHIFMQLCEAMDVAHQEGVIHRDLKPENIFLVNREGDEHFVKVIDFGIAKPTDSISADAPQLTRGPLGTPAYMSPEQCAHKDLDHRSDIYSMGIMLYELILGYSPYLPPGRTASAQELLISHLCGEPPPMRQARPDLEIPEALERIVFRALSREPDARYATARDMKKAIESEVLAAGTMVSVMAAGAVEFPATSPGRPAVGTDTFPGELDDYEYNTNSELSAVPSALEVNPFATPAQPVHSGTMQWGAGGAQVVETYDPYQYSGGQQLVSSNLEHYEQEATAIAPFPLPPRSVQADNNTLDEEESTVVASSLQSLGGHGLPTPVLSPQNVSPSLDARGQMPTAEELVEEKPLTKLLLPLGLALSALLLVLAVVFVFSKRNQNNKRPAKQIHTKQIPAPPPTKRVIPVIPTKRVIPVQKKGVPKKVVRPVAHTRKRAPRVNATPRRRYKRRTYRAPPIRRVARNPNGCPPNAHGIRWVHVVVAPRKAKARLDFMVGRARLWTVSNGKCIGLKSRSVKVRVRARSYRPCILHVSGRRASERWRLTPYDPNEPEDDGDDYCRKR